MGQVHQGDLVSDQGRQLRELGVVQVVLGIEHDCGGALALFELTFFRFVKASGYNSILLARQNALPIRAQLFCCVEDLQFDQILAILLGGKPLATLQEDLTQAALGGLVSEGDLCTEAKIVTGM
jgi:hypothetical protein